MNATRTDASLVDTTLAVEGMTCTSCVSHVTRALLDLAGVQTVHVDLSKGRAHVSHSGDEGLLDEMIEALADAGYDASPRT